LLARPEELQQVGGRWPGPVTFVFTASNAAPKAVCAADGSIAIRVSDHPLAAALALASDVAIVSTSANPAGQPPATTADQVNGYFGNAVDGLLEGETGGREQPSQIIDARSGSTLRQG
jgi:L-threonylcarbamoyladenylate synthase